MSEWILEWMRWCHAPSHPPPSLFVFPLPAKAGGGGGSGGLVSFPLAGAKVAGT